MHDELTSHWIPQAKQNIKVHIYYHKAVCLKIVLHCLCLTYIPLLTCIAKLQNFFTQSNQLTMKSSKQLELGIGLEFFECARAQLI